jgi:hypothetical protein
MLPNLYVMGVPRKNAESGIGISEEEEVDIGEEDEVEEEDDALCRWVGAEEEEVGNFIKEADYCSSETTFYRQRKDFMARHCGTIRDLPGLKESISAYCQVHHLDRILILLRDSQGDLGDWIDGSATRFPRRRRWRCENSHSRHNTGEGIHRAQQCSGLGCIGRHIKRSGGLVGPRPTSA